MTDDYERAKGRLRDNLVSMLYLALYDMPVSWDGLDAGRVVDVWLQDNGGLVVTIQKGDEQTVSVRL